LFLSLCTRTRWKNPLDAEQGGGLRPGPQLKRCD
jgi:hypothetical protein